MPGLNVYRSNRMEDLAAALAASLSGPGAMPADPMTPVEIVVGSRGMERWLRHQLADRLGICSNVQFPFLAGTLGKAVSGLVGQGAGGEGADRWRPDALVWALLEVIPGVLEGAVAGDPFRPLRDYLKQPGGTVGQRQYGLVRQIADMFDKYVLFRQGDVANRWSLGQGAVGSLDPEVQRWQRPLWQAVQAQLGGAPHAAQRMAEARELLARGEGLSGAAQRLRIFGVSSLPPAFLELLAALSAQVRVDLFVLCPSPLFWGDLQIGTVQAERLRELHREEALPGELRGLVEPRVSRAGHPLLLSFGRLARDFQIVLESLPVPYVDHPVPPPPGIGEGPQPTALQALQGDIREQRLEPARRLPQDPADDSIQVHACHGPTRQVEVLRDVLLGLFADHPDLQPRDVLVMTPDIEAFAPLVTAVFAQGRASRSSTGWGDTGAPYIPHEIADVTVRKTNPVADALLRVLALAEGRLKASDVLGMLALEPVRQRFGIGDDDLPQLQEWVSASGIRWGRDAADRTQQGQPADPQNTWQFGLERLFLGVAMADDGSLWRGIVPVDDLEGGATVLLGRLADFCRTLFAVVEELGPARPVAEWIDSLAGSGSAPGVIDRLTATSLEAGWLRREVVTELDALATSARDAGSARPLTAGALAAALEGRFEIASRGSKQQSGAVTFCSMVPFRSVPYRVVCLLGMDEEVFPRSPIRLGFDLVALHPRVGDRDPREEDRYMLLEALLAARDHLVVLYTGRDVRSNEAIAPAVPIGELMDVIDASFPAVDGMAPSSLCTTFHPLQSFSPANFLPLHPDTGGEGGGLRPWSFDRRLMRGGEVARTTTRESWEFYPAELAAAAWEGPAADEPFQIIELADLARFFIQPTRALLQQRYRLHLYERGEDLSDREPVELGGLEGWQLQQDLLAAWDAARERGEVGDEPATTVLARMRAEGRLPLGAAGERAAEGPMGVVEHLMNAAAPWFEAGVVSEPIEFQLPGARATLTGRLPRVCGDDELFLKLGKDGTSRPMKWLIEPWLHLLARRVMEPERESKAVMLHAYIDKGVPGCQRRHLEFPDELGDAVKILEGLVGLYRRGIRAPLPLFEKSSWKFAWMLHKVCSVEDFGDDFRGFSEQPLAGKLSDALAAAVALWQPMIDPWDTPGDLDDPHVARLYGDRCPVLAGGDTGWAVSPEFARSALQLWKPIFQARKTRGGC